MRRITALGLGWLASVAACDPGDALRGSGKDSGEDVESSANYDAATPGFDAAGDAAPDGGDATVDVDGSDGVGPALDAASLCPTDSDCSAAAEAQSDAETDARADASSDETEAQDAGPEAGSDSTARCASGYSFCGTTCLNTSTDPNNCGTCGQSCTGSCLAGECTINATFLGAGHYHFCAIVSGGAVICWGDNLWGELGNGSGGGTEAGGFPLPNNSPIPVAVSGLTGATAIAAGDSYTCAIVSGGAVECWGYSTDGELGNGTAGEVFGGMLTSSSVPVAVSGLTGATAIAAGSNHACAIVSGGAVMCWGGTGAGALGNGTTNADSFIPVAVSGLTGATAIAAGDDYTCAIVSGGAVMCWGNDRFGQLGNPTSSTTTPNPYPVPVSGLTGATAITAGADHTCAIVSGGAVMCWGYNVSGQLGNGMNLDSPIPVAVSLSGGATAIAAGGDHTCAIVSGGAVMCWGDNTAGELGNGMAMLSPPFLFSNLPVSAIFGSSASATAIAAGVADTCAIIVGGAIECWGSNTLGELGNGSTLTYSSTPVVVVQ
jgi:alpha-tubulin suppressor-like RCC1 family protein